MRSWAASRDWPVTRAFPPRRSQRSGLSVTQRLPTSTGKPKKYLEIPVEEQVEVASLNGDIGVDEKGEPALHIHLVLGKRDGSAVAGHLTQAHVRPTLEVIVTESPAHLSRRKDTETGLNLIRM
jgi:predicted DNA-binding protein with PD1-like motif